MKQYKHLTQTEREKIAALKNEGATIAQIAETVGKSVSTIYRELSRNEAPPGQYWPDRAQRLYCLRRERGALLDKNIPLQTFVLEKLQCHGWSPEQIAADLKYNRTELPSVCHETIYAWIYGKTTKKDKLWKYLRYHKGKRGKRACRNAGVSRIPSRVSVHERPEEISNRGEFGHWEGDLMAFRKNSQNILVTQERVSRFVISERLARKLAAEVGEKMKKVFKELPRKARKSITFDNGGEFARHMQLKDIGMKTYFCDPYASWQKGGVENANGRLRADLPRRLSVKEMKEEDFDEVIDNYNTTPRKCLGWKTPLQVFQENLQLVALRP